MGKSHNSATQGMCHKVALCDWKVTFFLSSVKSTDIKYPHEIFEDTVYSFWTMITITAFSKGKI